MEAVADIAFFAGLYRHHSKDSRKDIADYIQWAEEFESNRAIDLDGNETYFGKDYMTAIEQFALTRLEAEGAPKQAKLLVVALADFLRVWTDGQLLHDVGEHLSCEECTVLEELLRAHGYHESADNLVDGHVMSDDQGDDPKHLERKRELERINEIPF